MVVPAMPSQYPRPLSGVSALSSRLLQPIQRQMATAAPNTKGMMLANRDVRRRERVGFERARAVADARSVSVRRGARTRKSPVRQSEITESATVSPPLHEVFSMPLYAREL